MKIRLKKYTILLNLLWLIPVVTLAYIGWANIMPLGGTLRYVIDVGGEDNEGSARIASPTDRISAGLEADGETFRELQHPLVYFELEEPALNKAESITVTVWFRDAFNSSEKFVLGARNAAEWSYYWQNIYLPFYAELEQLPLVAVEDGILIYATDPANTSAFTNVADFLTNPSSGATIATNDEDLPLNQSAELPSGAASNSVVVETSLRGAHTLWTYVSNGTLQLNITKQDLNWYAEADELTVEVYSAGDELLATVLIPDDGDADESKTPGPLQETSLMIENLSPGAYRIELKSNSDLLVTRLEVNQNYLVAANQLYLTGNSTAYYPDADTTPVDIYSRGYTTGQVRFYTWHNAGKQDILIESEESTDTLSISEVKTDYFADIPAGDYRLNVPRQDILIEAPGYFAFTPESYFLPQRCQIIDLKYDMDWLLANADYVIINTVDYATPVADDGWLIAQATWQLTDLYVSENKLGFCFNVPHLTDNPDRVVAIERIEITLEIPPWWERD